MPLSESYNIIRKRKIKLVNSKCLHFLDILRMRFYRLPKSEFTTNIEFYILYLLQFACLVLKMQVNYAQKLHNTLRKLDERY